MKQSLFLFFAPGPAARSAIGEGWEVREPQARPLPAIPTPGRLRGILVESAQVLANAVGFVALIAACWLLLPMISLLVS